MKKNMYNELTKKIEKLEVLLNGGKGSGNFGHAGRPGEVGGSAPEKFSAGASVEFETGYGEHLSGKILRKLSDEEKEERSGIANPDAGDYYEIETASGSKSIVWEARIKSKEQEAGEKSKDTSFHSRYEGGSAPIEYDGDTFYPDKDGRGMSTKDGKRSMMFPDEILHARQEIVDDWKKRGLTETSYKQAKELYFKTKKDSNITDQDPRDKEKATRLAGEIGAVIRRYEEENPWTFLK